MPTLQLNPIELCVVIALAAQIPLAALAILTAFSQRKKLRSSESLREPADHAIETVTRRADRGRRAGSSAGALGDSNCAGNSAARTGYC